MRWVNRQKCYWTGSCLCCFYWSRNRKANSCVFQVVAPSESQDAPGLKKAIFKTFIRNSLESVSEKIVFLSSDHPRVSFIWCFSHRLELALKDVVKELLEPVDTSLCDLYLYAKSSKKHRELKNLLNVL